MGGEDEAILPTAGDTHPHTLPRLEDLKRRKLELEEEINRVKSNIGDILLDTDTPDSSDSVSYVPPNLSKLPTEAKMSTSWSSL